MVNIHKKLKKLHKIKVHHNRWLIWAIVSALFATIALVGYIKISEEYFGAQVSNFNDVETWKMYRDSRLGFSMNYPGKWVIESQRNGIEFSDPKQPADGITISFYDPKDEVAVLAGINKVSEERFKIGDLIGMKYTDSISKKVNEEVILVKYNNKLYSIRGSGKSYEKVLSSFKFN